MNRILLVILIVVFCILGSIAIVIIYQRISPTPSATKEPTTTLPTNPSFLPIPAVAKEDTTCYFGTNDGYDAFVTIPQYSIVSVLGKDSSGQWMLVRLEGFADCWIHSTSLQLMSDVGNLPTITNIFPPAETPAASTEIVQTELSNQTPYPPIGLTWKILSFDCNSNNKATRALVDLNVSGGIPPYQYSQQLPLYARPEEVVFIIVSSSTLNGEPSEAIRFTIPRASDFKCNNQGNNNVPPPTIQPPTLQPPTIQPPTLQPPTIQPPGIIPSPPPACSDGKDNDSDSLVDYGSDPQCDSPNDSHEDQ